MGLATPSIGIGFPCANVVVALLRMMASDRAVLGSWPVPSPRSRFLGPRSQVHFGPSGDAEHRHWVPLRQRRRRPRADHGKRPRGLGLVARAEPKVKIPRASRPSALRP